MELQCFGLKIKVEVEVEYICARTLLNTSARRVVPRSSIYYLSKYFQILFETLKMLSIEKTDFVLDVQAWKVVAGVPKPVCQPCSLFAQPQISMNHVTSISTDETS